MLPGPFPEGRHDQPAHERDRPVTRGPVVEVLATRCCTTCTQVRQSGAARWAYEPFQTSWWSPSGLATRPDPVPTSATTHPPGKAGGASGRRPSRPDNFRAPEVQRRTQRVRQRSWSIQRCRPRLVAALLQRGHRGRPPANTAPEDRPGGSDADRGRGVRWAAVVDFVKMDSGRGGPEGIPACWKCGARGRS